MYKVDADIVRTVNRKAVLPDPIQRLCALRRLKEKGRIFREAFLQKLALLLRGTVAAPPERFGETLADEHIRGGEPSSPFRVIFYMHKTARGLRSAKSRSVLCHTGAFVAPDGKALPPSEGLPNSHMRLFGGAQYHRAMAEFRTSIGQLTCPDISRHACSSLHRFCK